MWKREGREGETVVLYIHSTLARACSQANEEEGEETQTDEEHEEEEKEQQEKEEKEDEMK
jgi:ribosomal protein L12E/L44/L45/RPP1/RPP2